MIRSLSVPPPSSAPRAPTASPAGTTGPRSPGTVRRPEDRHHWLDPLDDPAGPDIACMQIRSHTAADACTVTVSGEIDCVTAPDLREVVLDLLDRPHPTGGVVLDLRRVTFLDAAGLTVLAVAHHRAEQTGDVLRIRCGGARAVIRPLQLTGLWRTLHIVHRGAAGRSG